jgi:hypothetical protein
LAEDSCGATLWTLCLCVLKKRLETQRHRGHGEEKKELEGWIGSGERYRGGLPKLDWIRSVVGRLYLGNAVVSIASAFKKKELIHGAE